MRKRFIVEVEINPAAAKRTHAEWAIILEQLIQSSETTYHKDMHIYTARVLKKDPNK